MTESRAGPQVYSFPRNLRGGAPRISVDIAVTGRNLRRAR